jgi:hypothetical protein
MLVEWRKSVAVLSDIVGEPVRVASVPQGYYSPLVAETAAEAGIEALFTSEPTNVVRRVHGCLVFGRLSILRNMSPALAASLAAGRRLPTLRQWAWWSAKGIAKRVTGEHYQRLRALLLRGVEPAGDR